MKNSYNPDIYIVSPNDDRNYGAVLQAYALQQFLSLLGYNSRFIVIRKKLNSILECRYNSLHSLIKSFFVMLHRKELTNSCNRFEYFVNCYQNCTEVYENYDDLYINPPVGKVYIAGSDQIWVPENMLPMNFLDFAPRRTKKISYAASLGKDTVPDQYRETFSKFISNFDSISIREETAVPAVEGLSGKKVIVNIDPTLLLEAGVWNGLEKEVRGLEKKYILLYMIYVPENINSFLKKLRKESGLDIYLVSNTPYKRVYCDKHIRDAGPQEFLWLIHHAEAVISSSYHGAIFSILFEKPFLCVIDEKKPVRLKCLLSKFGLEDKIFDREKTVDVFDMPDFEKVRMVLKTEREKAKEYLLRAINGEADE